MRGGESIGNLRGQLEAIDNRNSSRLDEIGQGFPAHKLHHDAFAFVARDDFVDRNDIRMVQRGSGTGLLKKSRAVVVFFGRPADQYLYGNEASPVADLSP